MKIKCQKCHRESFEKVMNIHSLKDKYIGGYCLKCKDYTKGEVT